MLLAAWARRSGQQTGTLTVKTPTGRAGVFVDDKT
jgi:hypothetical protein